MKTMLLRVGIDKGSDDRLSPILPDGNFEYIPLSESDEKSGETRTYHELIGLTENLSPIIPSKIA